MNKKKKIPIVSILPSINNKNQVRKCDSSGLGVFVLCVVYCWSVRITHTY